MDFVFKMMDFALKMMILWRYAARIRNWKAHFITKSAFGLDPPGTHGNRIVIALPIDFFHCRAAVFSDWFPTTLGLFFPQDPPLLFNVDADPAEQVRYYRCFSISAAMRMLTSPCFSISAAMRMLTSPLIEAEFRLTSLGAICIKEK